MNEEGLDNRPVMLPNSILAVNQQLLLPDEKINENDQLNRSIQQ